MHWFAWGGKVQSQQQSKKNLTAELFIAEDKSFVECTWTAGASLTSGSYEFYGEGETYTGDKDTVEKYDTRSLNGGLQVAARVLEEMIGVDQIALARKIVEQLHSITKK